MMSKYHPLDVRHPANRDLLSRNFLLDPPAQDRVGPSTRARRAQSILAPSPSTTETQPETVNPWGQRGKAATSGPAQRPTVANGARTPRKRRRGGLLTWVILIGTGMYVLSQPEGGRMLNDLARFVTDFLDDTLR